ncbi:rCG39194, partial [Rattus norvegicus]
MNSDRPLTRTRGSCRQSCCRRSNEHPAPLRDLRKTRENRQLEFMTDFNLGTRPPQKSHLLVAENSTVMGRHSPGTPELPGRDRCLQVPRGLVYT